METITSLFTDIIALQNSIGYSMADYLLPGLSVDELKKLEQTLGVKFNNEIFELYGLMGGIDGQGVSMGKLQLLPLNIMASSEYIIEYAKANKEFVSMFPDYYETNGLNYFCFLIDGGAGKYWIDLNQGNYYGKVLEDFGAGEPPEYTFNSIKSYLYFVKQCYANGIVFLDDDSLECDFDQMHEYKERYLINHIA